MPLLHKNPDNLPRGRTETDRSAWEMLKRFRAKVEASHTCSYWTTPDDLKAAAILGITAAVKRKPGVGWIRADRVPTDATIAEILALRKQVAGLQAQLEASASNPPPGTEELAKDGDLFSVLVGFTVRRKDDTYPYRNDRTYTYTITPTWNEIFAGVAPSLINEAPDSTVRKRLHDVFKSRLWSELVDDDTLDGATIQDFGTGSDAVDTAIIQLRALGLMRESVKQRSVKDTKTYWTLTPFGDKKMTQLRARRRQSSGRQNPPTKRSKPRLAKTEPVKLRETVAG